MDAQNLNLDTPFLSVKQMETEPEDSNESQNKDSFEETEQETLIQLLQDQSFNHAMEPSSDIINALEMVSSTASFSGNCSSSGVSEFERSSNESREDVIPEYRDLIMSRFLPAAEAIALKHKKEASRVEEERKKKQSIALHRVSMAINQDLNNYDDEDQNQVNSDGSKKPQLGFLPWSCSKNSMEVLNPVLSRVKTCQDIGVKPEKFDNRKPQESVRRTRLASPRISKSNKIMSNCQEIYTTTPRFSKEKSKISPSKSSEIIRIPRNSSRLQRNTSSIDQSHRQETRFLAAEVKRRHNRNKNKSENLSVSQPPLPKTPSESWLFRTLPRCSAVPSDVISGKAVGYKKKIEQKTNSQSINWETIVKTSYKHNDHVRYSKDLIVVRPSRQHKS